MLSESEKNKAWTRVWELNALDVNGGPRFFKGLTEEERQALLGDYYDFLDYEPAKALHREMNEPKPLVATPIKPLTGMVALCVGHSRPGDNGAVSAGGVSERSFNREVARLTSAALRARGVGSVVIDAYQGSSYGAAMTNAASQIKKAAAGLALELHFNCSDGAARGFEYLHSGSAEGKRLATCLYQAHTNANTVSSPGRGVKKVGERGAGFVNKAPCPAVICEPFFGDNRVEWGYWSKHVEELAAIYADGIVSYLS